MSCGKERMGQTFWPHFVPRRAPAVVESCCLKQLLQLRRVAGFHMHCFPCSCRRSVIAVHNSRSEL